MKYILNSLTRHLYKNFAHFFAAMSVFFMLFIFTRNVLISSIVSILIVVAKEYIKAVLTSQMFLVLNLLCALLGALAAYIIVFIYQFFFLL